MRLLRLENMFAWIFATFKLFYAEEISFSSPMKKHWRTFYVNKKNVFNKLPPRNISYFASFNFIKKKIEKNSFFVH